MQKYFMVCSDGHLYDTRRKNWAERPLRWNYGRFDKNIDMTPEGSIALRAAVRNPFIWPGGYELAYYTQDGSCLCHKCVRENYALIAEERRAARDNKALGRWAVCGVDIAEYHDEGLWCDECNNVIVPGHE